MRLRTQHIVLAAVLFAGSSAVADREYRWSEWFYPGQQRVVQCRIRPTDDRSKDGKYGWYWQFRTGSAERVWFDYWLAGIRDPKKEERHSGKAVVYEGRNFECYDFLKVPPDRPLYVYVELEKDK